VCYNLAVLTGDSEALEVSYETREAQVTGFSNDGNTVTLTFQGENPGEVTQSEYTVRFAGTEAYAVVHVASVDNGVVIEDVDFDAQIAELEAYEPDFEEADIDLPEGTYIEDGELVVTEDAPEAMADVLVESGFAESELSRDVANDANDANDAAGDAGNGDANADARE
jgi:hypothetical protein